MTAVAILGTGKMGSAMARRLAASGFHLTLWNRTSTKAEDLGVGRVPANPAEATDPQTHDAAVRRTACQRSSSLFTFQPPLRTRSA
jgi:3-hydroxyisobutyrate dehydrogenase-like beta-hydroxyacid dehydrogenase